MIREILCIHWQRKPGLYNVEFQGLAFHTKLQLDWLSCDYLLSYSWILLTFTAGGLLSLQTHSNVQIYSYGRVAKCTDPSSVGIENAGSVYVSLLTMIEGSTVSAMETKVVIAFMLCYSHSQSCKTLHNCVYIQVIIMLTICFHIPDLYSCMPYAACVHNPIHTEEHISAWLTFMIVFIFIITSHI